MPADDLRPTADVLEPAAVATWLDTDVAWVLHAIAHDELPILGRRDDGTPLLAAEEVRQWLRRPRPEDDCT